LKDQIYPGKVTFLLGGSPQGESGGVGRSNCLETDSLDK